MTNTLRRILVTILAVCGVVAMSLAVSFMAACQTNPDPGPSHTTYTLTFVTNGGPAVSPIKAEAGTDISAKLPKDADMQRKDYEFAGWYRNADFSDGRQTLPTTMPEENRTYYAKWEGGNSTPAEYSGEYIDLFGGQDILTVKDGKISLERKGLGIVPGEFNPLNGYFSFVEDDDIILEGIIVNDIYFYYFRDISGKTFRYGNESIKFTGENNVTYTSADGKSVSGTFTVDLFVSDFIFSSATEEFAFRVDVEKGTYVKPNGPERGLYYYTTPAGNTELLFLDGFTLDSGVEYAHSGLAAAYRYNQDGTLTLSVVGYYLPYSGTPALDADINGIDYAIIINDGAQKFRLNTKDAGEVGEFDVKGSFLTSDSAFGEYRTEMGVLTDGPYDLILDGFGRGTYLDAKSGQMRSGSYSYENMNYLMFSTSSGTNWWRDDWVEFVFDGEEEIHYLRVVYSSQYLEWIYYEQTTTPGLTYVENNTNFLYGDYFRGMYQNLAFYNYAEVFDETVGYYYSAVYVWTYIDDVDYGLRIYEQIDYGYLIPKNDGTGEYRFQSTYMPNYVTSGEEFNYDVKYITGTVDGEQTTVARCAIPNVENDEILINDGSHKLTYTKYGEMVYFDGVSNRSTYDYDRSYSVVGGEASTVYYDVISLYLDRETINIVNKMDLLSGQILDTYYFDAAENNFGDLVRKVFYEQSSGYDKMLLLGENVALIRVQAEEYDTGNIVSLWFSGTYKATGGADEYEYTIDDVESLLLTFGSDADIATVYAQFKFLWRGNAFYLFTEGGGTFDVEQGGSIFLDGFGNATLTDGNKKTEYTYFIFPLENDSFSLVALTDAKGATIFIKGTVVNGVIEEYTILESAQDYYFMYTNGFIYSSFMLIVLGDEDGTAVTTDGYIYYLVPGTERKISYMGFDWTEYAFLYNYTDPETGEEAEYEYYYAVMADFLTIGDFKGKIFIERPLGGYIMNYKVNGGGTLTSDGYNEADYTDANYYSYSGVAQLGNWIMDTPDANYFDVATDDPHQVIFYYDRQEIEGTSYYMNYLLFDIEANGSLTLRPLLSGAYYKYEKGNILKEYIVLDGFGYLTIYDENGRNVGEAEYEFLRSDETGTLFTWKEFGKNVVFLATRAQSPYVAGEIIFIYIEVEGDNTIINDDWSVFIAGYFGEATYIDHYGVSHTGTYRYLTDTLVGFEYLTNLGYVTMYFDVYADYFTVNEEEFIIRDGVLYAYQGPRYVENLRIPDGVTEIFDSVFYGMDAIMTLDLNQVEKVGDFAFASVGLLGGNGGTFRADKLRWIGDFAFDTYEPYWEYSCWYNSIILPAVEHIGVRAFCFWNQLSGGSITLGANIEYIGQYAFAINQRISGDDLLTTEIYMLSCNNPNLYIHPDAFFNLYYGAQGGMYVQTNIYVTSEAVANAIRANQPAFISAGIKFINVTDIIRNGTFYSFTDELMYTFSGNNVTRTTIDGKQTTFSFTTANNVITLTSGSEKITLTYDGVNLVNGSSVYYKTGVTNTVSVRETNASWSLGYAYYTFTFNFTTKVEPDGITFTFNSGTYNGQSASDRSIVDGIARFRYTVDNNGTPVNYADDIVTFVKINLADLTSISWINQVTVRNSVQSGEEPAFRATVRMMDGYGRPIEGDRQLTLEMQTFDGNNEVWVVIGKDLARQGDSKNGYYWTVEYEGKTYTVTFTGVDYDRIDEEEGIPEDFTKAVLVVEVK